MQFLHILRHLFGKGLKKKNVSIAYHKVRECFVAGIINVYFQYSEDNLADVFTKVLPVLKRKNIFECIFAI